MREINPHHFLENEFGVQLGVARIVDAYNMVRKGLILSEAQRATTDQKQARDSSDQFIPVHVVSLVTSDPVVQHWVAFVHTKSGIPPLQWVIRPDVLIPG